MTDYLLQYLNSVLNKKEQKVYIRYSSILELRSGNNSTAFLGEEQILNFIHTYLMDTSRLRPQYDLSFSCRP